MSVSIGICFNDDVPWGAESHRIDNLKETIKKIYRNNKQLSDDFIRAGRIAIETGDRDMARAFISKSQGLLQANLNMRMFLEGYGFGDILKEE